jgi:hypothetical protein
MPRLTTQILALLLGFLICTTALAAEEEESDTIIQLTPRIWLSYLNIVNDEEASTDQIFIPLYGFTFGVNPSANLNLLLTAFYGEGDGDYINIYEGIGTTEVERTDVEFLVRYNFPGKKFSLFGGGRYVDFKEDNMAGAFLAEDDITFWLAEVGLGIVADISDNGRHRLFGNFTAAAAFGDWQYRDSNGYVASDDGVEPAFDFNFGYQYVIGSHLSFSVRYRGFIIFDSNDYDHTRLNTLHGPELALAIYF